MRLQPLGNMVVLQLSEKQEASAGGIFLPQATQKDPNVATVLAVGTGIKSGFDGITIPCLCKVGDKVIINRNAVITVEFEGKPISYLSEADIIMIVKDE